ncbi:hypothetical protein JXR93_12575 [bacterium]|nr:hypothetical protein [bacterium]
MTHFLTNSNQENSFNKRFNNLLNLNLKELNIVTGFLRVSGFLNINPKIKDVQKLKILVGIKTDKTIHDLSKGFNFDNINIVTIFKNMQIKTIQKQEYTKDSDKNIENNFNIIKEMIKENRLEIKIHSSRKVHAKLYVFIEDCNIENEFRGEVITGSSNFTKQGLTENIEINVQLNNTDDIKKANEIFYELWKDGVEITLKDIDNIKQKTYLKNITPHELYIKLLIEHFKYRLETDFNYSLPKNFMDLSYQKDAVIQGYEMLKKYNGFFLSDVVGLGKTLIASMIVQKYLFDNEKDLVLVVAPPSVEYSWKTTLNQFENVERRYDFISNSQLNKINNPEKYSLIVVDESHQFRNSTTEKYKELEKICKSKTKDGKQKKTILVSATPLNNHPEDIANQIYLFQDSRASTIPSFFDLQSYFSKIYKDYTEAIKSQTDEEMVEKLTDISNNLRENILKPVMVRRTRKDIEMFSKFKDDLVKQNIIFPKVNDVIELEYVLNDNLLNLFYETITIITEKLTYFRYQAVAYLKKDVKEKRKKEQNTNEGFYEMISKQLATLMKTLLVKRVESSFHAFKQSLLRFTEQTKWFINQFEKDEIIIAPELNPYNYFAEGKEDELFKKLKEGNIFRQKDFEDGFIDKVKNDYELLKDLSDKWKDINDDPKLDYFKITIENLLKTDKKIVIFTESSETSNYLGEKLNKKDVLIITGENRKHEESKIRDNFDANNKSLKNDYNILVTTDTLAEGVNLHSSNIIINYDIPWNSTKLIQRIGRINRIGTKHPEIFIYNFIPTSQSENLIQLAKTAFAKLQSFHNTLGGDNQIFTTKEEVKTFEIFNKINDVDSEEDDELQLFEDLVFFKERHPKEYKKISKLPKKIRVVNKKDSFNNTTFIYFKNGNLEKYYKISDKDSDIKIENLSFVNFAKNLKDNPQNRGEKNIPETHYNHVNQAISFFEKELKENNKKINKVLVPVNNPTDKKAIASLKNLQKIFKNKKESDIISYIIYSIQLGQYQTLSRQINRMFNSVKHEHDLLKEIVKLFYSYRIEKNEKNEDKIDIKTILSETFI